MAEPVADTLGLFETKKKKKKKIDLDSVLSASGGGGGENNAPDVGGDADGGGLGGGGANDAQPQEAGAGAEEEGIDLESFGLKKKKKGKKAVPTAEDVAAAAAAAAVELIGVVSSEEALGGGEDLDLFGQKKKKKNKGKLTLDDQAEPMDQEGEMALSDDEDEEQSVSEASSAATGPPKPQEKAWLLSDRDYTYDELLTRVFEIMHAKNPEMVAGTKQKFVMRPPQVLRVGTKKTSFVNFMEICKMLHRHQKHLLDFLLSELGTSGSIDGNNQLIIKGKFQQKQIENVLRRYIKEYVTCHTCRSPQTILQKDSRIFFLQCEACGSRCSVASIKHGFQAVTSKRAAIRAKAT